MADDTRKAKLAELTAPFELSAISWRPVQFNKDLTRAIAYAYVDSRAVVERLDTVFPGNWSLTTEIVSETQYRVVVRATITIGPVCRTGIGEAEIKYRQTTEGLIVTGEPYKAAESDAIKRAAVNWGIGRYLYSLPTVWVPWDKQRGDFAVDPASIIFGKDDKVKRDKRSRTEPSTASVPPPLPKAKIEAEADEPIPPIPSAEAEAGIPPPAVEETATHKSPPIDQNQLNWIANVYKSSGQPFPEERFKKLTRKGAAKWIANAIKSAGNDDAPTAAQIEALSKLASLQGEELPEDLSQLTVKTISLHISRLIKAQQSK